MKKYWLICFILLFIYSCKDLLEDPDGTRKGLVIDKTKLLSISWKVGYSSEFPLDSDPFENSFLEFYGDNTFDLVVSEKEIYTGEWALSAGNDLLVIRSDGKIPPPFDEIENEWIFRAFEGDYIAIEEQNISGGEVFQFSKAHVSELPLICNSFARSIHGRAWRIEQAVIKNVNVTSDFQNYSIAFDSLGGLWVSGQESIKGNWNPGIRCNSFKFAFNHDGKFGDLQVPWKVNYLTESEIKLSHTQENDKWEFYLTTGIALTSDFCKVAEPKITSDDWQLSQFTIGNENHSADFTQFSFNFTSDQKLIVSDNEREYEGKWSMINNCELFNIDISDNEVLKSLNHEWQVVLITNETMKLVSELENQSLELTFDRILEPDNPLVICDNLKQRLSEEHTWKVIKYLFDGREGENPFENITMQFKNDQSIVFNINLSRTVIGKYSISDDCSDLTISTETNDSSLDPLAKTWKIDRFTEETLIIRRVSNESELILHLEY